MSRIIKTMQLFNYSPDSVGVCYGISMMAAQACLRQNNEAFANRVEFIRNCTKVEIETIKNSKQGDAKFAKKVDLLCFFDGISMYQGADSVNADFKSIAPQNQDMRRTRKILTSKAFKNDNQFVYPEIKTRLINAYTRKEFLAFIQTIKHYFGRYPFSIKIDHSPISHTTLIGFDGNKWLSANHDSVVLSEDNFNALQKVVDNIFLLEQNRSTKQMSAIFDIIQPVGLPIRLALLKPLTIAEPSAKKTIKSFNKGTIFRLLACYVKAYRFENYFTLLHKLSSFTLTEKEKRKLVEAKRNNNTTALHIAAYACKKGIVNRILKTMDEFGLSFETKISIVNKKHDQGITALFYAAELGDKSIVKSLLDLGQGINDSTLKADFLYAGKSALFAAAENGHLKVVRQLIKAISTIEDEMIQSELLLSKANEGMSALFIAAQQGYAKIVSELVNAILSIADEAVQVEGLAAVNNNGDCALLMAMKKGHKEVAKALIKGITSIENEKGRTALLTATNNEGSSALSVAKQLSDKDIIALLHTALSKEKVV